MKGTVNVINKSNAGTQVRMDCGDGVAILITLKDPKDETYQVGEIYTVTFTKA